MAALVVLAAACSDDDADSSAEPDATTTTVEGAQVLELGPDDDLYALAEDLERGMVAAGWEAAYPDADPALVLSPLGLERLQVVDDGCSAELATAWNDEPYESLVSADPAEVEPWASLLVENDPGYVVGASPVLIIHGGDDEQIPVVSSELLLTRMCGVGQVVERRVYPGESHAGVIGPSMPDMLGWIDDRLSGVDPPTSC